MPGGAWKKTGLFWAIYLRAAPSILRASSEHFSGHFLRAFFTWVYFYLSYFFPESFFCLSQFLPESFLLRAFPSGILYLILFCLSQFFAWVSFYLSHFSSGHFLRAFPLVISFGHFLPESFFPWVSFFKVNMTSLWSNFAGVSAIFLIYKKILKFRYLHAFFSKNSQ